VPSRGRAPGPRSLVRRQSALLAAAGVVLVILLLTLWPLPEQSYEASLSPVSCLVCGDQGLQDVIQNVLMLLPLGLFLGLAGFGPGRAALLGFLLSLTVEVLQYFVVTGRDAAISDVITNTTGAALGAAFAPHLGSVVRPGRLLAGRLAIAAVLLFAAVWSFGAWALEGSTGAGNWRGRFPGDLPDAPALSGEAVRASINDVPLALAPASLPGWVERAFARDSFTLRVEVRPGAPIAWRENVITIIDMRQDSLPINHLVMTLNRVRPRALLTFRINAARARLRTPSFDLGRVFDVPPGTTVSLAVTRRRGALHAVADRGGLAMTTDYRIGPELLWSVLAPRTPNPGMAWVVETFLWGAAVLLVAGYWSGRAASRTNPLLVGAIAAAVQVLVPRFFNVAGQTLLGWTMLLGGLFLGVLIGRGSPQLPTD
jgi:hypothetical protein